MKDLIESIAIANKLRKKRKVAKLKRKSAGEDSTSRSTATSTNTVTATSKETAITNILKRRKVRNESFVVVKQKANESAKECFDQKNKSIKVNNKKSAILPKDVRLHYKRMAFKFLSTVMSMHIDTSVAPEDTRYFSENWNEEEHNYSPKDEEHPVKKS